MVLIIENYIVGGDTNNGNVLEDFLTFIIKGA
jgi:hypothetical protein